MCNKRYTFPYLVLCLQAAAKALEMAKSKGIPKLILHTDSMYTINCE